MIQWLVGVFSTWLVLFAVATANLGGAISESLVSDAGLAAVCGTSDKSWEKDIGWSAKCHRWLEAMSAEHLKSVYEAAHEPRL